MNSPNETTTFATMNFTNETTAATTTAVDIPIYNFDCEDFIPVPSEYINYACVPSFALVILISFLVKRKHLCPGCCQGRPGILTPMDLIAGTSSRLALAAAFAILTSRLMRLVWSGDRYWQFPGMEDPVFAKKYSLLRIFIKIGNSVQLSMCFYPLFVCIIHRKYIILNILGYLTLIPWFYFTVKVIEKCHLATLASNADQAAMFLMELPELLAYVYLIWFFSKHLFLNIYRKARCRQCEGGSFDLTGDDDSLPLYIIYVRGLFQRKEGDSTTERPTESQSDCEAAGANIAASKVQVILRRTTGKLAKVKESVTFRKISGYRSSPRIIITLTVSCLSVYMIAWQFFGSMSNFGEVAHGLIRMLKEETSVDPDVLFRKEVVQDSLLAVVYGGYACFFLAMIFEFFNLWLVFVNYRKSVQSLLRGDKTVYKGLDMSPENMMIYASKYPGYQIAFAIYAYLVTVLLLVVIVVVIFTFLLVLPLKWGYEAPILELIKSHWQTILVGLIIYYSQVMFAKCVFFDRKSGIFNNRRLYNVMDYFLFFFNALVSLFTSLKRIVMSIVFGIIYLTRLDQCGMMRGLERFDTGHKAFLGMLYVEVTQNNPIVLTFIELLVRGATNRKGASKTSSQLPLDGVEEGEMTTIQDLKTRRHRWAVNKWQRCITLMNNHSLVLEQLSKNALENLAVEEPSKEDQGGQDDHKEPCSAANRNYDADA